MEGEVVTLQNLIVYEITGEDAQRQDHSAAIAPPASRGRASGSGPNTTARRPPGRGAGGRRGARRATATRWETRVDSSDLLLVGLLLLAAVSVRRRRLVLLVPYVLRRASHRQAHAGRHGEQGAAHRRPGAGRRCASNRRKAGRRYPEGPRGPAEGAREGDDAPAPAARRPRHHAARRSGSASVVCGGAVGLLSSVLPAPNLADHCAAVGSRSSARSACRAGSSHRLTKRRQNKFIDEFANAIDVIVRGVKSGLPLNECLSIIAREMPAAGRGRVQRACRAAARRRAARRSASTA